LTRHVRRIETSGDLSARLAMDRRDEVGHLADAFDRMVARVEEQTRDLASANSELELLATLDGLTGVANRRRYDEQIALEWRRAQRSRAPLSLIFGDVDHFKSYNDTYGHAAGDECLKAVARAFQGAARRAGDLVARYGGEEFVIILADTPLEGALSVARNARAAVERLAIEHREATAGRVTVSLGVATTVAERGAPASQLADAADRALYEAKAAGRNRVTAAPASGAGSSGQGVT
jgi:two-component system chemotaxis family response regulator WspR